MNNDITPPVVSPTITTSPINPGGAFASAGSTLSNAGSTVQTSLNDFPATPIPMEDIVLPEAVDIQPADSNVAYQEALYGNNARAHKNRTLYWTASFAAMSIALVGMVGLVIARSQSQQLASNSQNNYGATNIPLKDYTDATKSELGQLSQLDVNGRLQVNGALLLTPGELPSDAKAGQIYYDKTTNKVVYYNGADYRVVATNTDTVSSIDGQSGAIALGEGLSLANGVLTNTNAVQQPAGVTSFQGQTGSINLIAGIGIGITGTTITNNGITKFGNTTGDITLGAGLSLTGNTLNATATPTVLTTNTPTELTVTDNGNGSFTIDKVGAGGGGTVALGPVSPQADNTSDPSINIDKSTSGGLIQLSVSGSNRFVVNNSGVITSGTIAYSQVNGRPASVINSIDGSFGAITLDPTTLQISGNQLSVISSGAGLYVANNTNQSNANINIRSTNGAMPTALFTGNVSQSVNVLEVKNNAGNTLFSVGSAGASVFQPSTNMLNAFSVRNSGGTSILAVDTQGSKVNITGTSAVTALDVTGDINIDAGSSYKVNGVPICGAFGCLSAAGPSGGTGIENTFVFDTVNRRENISLYSQNDSQVTAAIQATAGQVTNVIDLLQFQAATTGRRTLAVDTAGALNFWDAATGNTFKSSLTFADPTSDTNFILPTSGGGGTEFICTDVNNLCSGSGTGITGSGTAGQLAYFNTGSTLAGSVISQSGVSPNAIVTIDGELRVTGIGGIGIGLANSRAGVVTFADATSANQVVISAPGLTGDVTLSLPTVGGTIAASAAYPLVLDPGTGEITCPTCGTTGGGGGPTTVTSLNGAQGAVTLANASQTGPSTVTINNAAADGATKGIAAFNATNFTSLNGVINTAQAINETANVRFGTMILGRNNGESSPTNGTLEFRNSANANTILLQSASTGTGTLTLPAINGTLIASVAAGSNLSASGGVLTLATIAADKGGTGQTAYVIGDLLYADSTTTLAKRAIGANGQCFISNGTLPSWGSCAGTAGTGATIDNTYTNYGTNPAVVNLATNGSRNGLLLQGSVSSGPLFAVQNTGGGTNYLSVTASTTTISNGLSLPSLADGFLKVAGGSVTSSGSVGLAGTDVSGTLPATKGGTDQNGYAVGDLLYASSSTTLGKRAIGGANGQCLIVASGLPVWGSCSGAGGSGAVTWQDIYANSGNPNKLDLTSGNGGLLIRQGTVAGGANTLFGIQNAGGLADYFKVDANGLTTVTGNLTVNGTGSLTAVSGTFSGANSLTLGTATSIDGEIRFRSDTAFTTTLKVNANPTASRTYYFPVNTADGEICIDSGNCGVASGSGNYIQNQNASAQTANFWLNATGRADVSLLTPTLDTATAVALNIGTTNATGINLNKATTVANNIAFNANGNSTFKAATNSATAFQVQNSSASNVLVVDTINSRIGIATGAVAPTSDLTFGIGAGRTIAVANQTAGNNAGNTLTVQSGAGFGTGAGGALTVQGGTGGAANAGGGLNLNGGNGGYGGGSVVITGGATGGGGAIAGGISLQAGSNAVGFGGGISLTTGTGASGDGNIALTAGGSSGNVSITSATTIGIGAPAGFYASANNYYLYNSNWSAETIRFDGNNGRVGIAINGTAPSYDLSFGTTAGTRNIRVETQSSANTVGGSLIMQAATGNGSGMGGALSLYGGSGGGTAGTGGGAILLQGGSGGVSGGNGGDTTISGGLGTGANALGGTVYILAGQKAGGLPGGAVVIRPQTGGDRTDFLQVKNASNVSVLVVDTTNQRLGIATGATAPAYDLTFGTTTGTRTVRVETQTTLNNTGGSLTLQAATGNGTGGGGILTLQAGASGSGATGNGGALTVNAGSAASTNGSGGALSVSGGNGAGTGSGGTLTLQAGASGSGAFGNGGALTINAGSAASTNGSGGNLTVSAGAATGTSGGGTLNLSSGAGGNAGGAINMTAANGATQGGSVSITAGNATANTATAAGNISLQAGSATDVNAGAVAGGSISLVAGTGSRISCCNAGGAITIQSGTGGIFSGTGGVLNLQAGTGGGASGAGGNTNITAGNAGGGNANGGNVTITAGALTGSGTGGKVTIKAGTGSNRVDFFQVQNASSTAILNVDTTNGRVGINNTAPNNTFNVNTPHTAVANTDAVITASVAGNRGLVIQAAATPTADAFQVQSSAGVVQAGITGSGRIFTGSTALASVQLSVQTGTSAIVGQVIKGVASQSANLLEFQNNTGTILSSFGATGNLTVGADTLVRPLTADSATLFRVQTQGGADILKVDSTNSIVTVTNAVVTGNLTVNGHIITSGGTAPTANVTGAVCTGSGITRSGSDTAGTLTITTGTGCAAGLLATLQFGTAYGVAPVVALTPANAVASSIQYYVNSSTTANFTVDTNSAPADSTVYKYYYHVLE